MILANITNPLLAMVDTAVVGHMDGVHFLAGTAVASMVVTQIYWICGFFRMSATGLAAQALGQQSKEAGARVLYQLIFPALMLGVLLIVLMPVLIWVAEWVADADQNVNLVVADYLSVRVWGAPMALSNLILMGWLVGQQKARTVMGIQIIGNLLNAGLNLLLVLVMDMGVAGVATASVIAEAVIFGSGLWVILRRLNWHGWRRHWFRLAEYQAVLKLNGDILLRNLALQFCMAVMTIQAARIGETTVAVNAIMMQFFVITALGLDGIAYAVEALVGESKGARRPRQLYFRTLQGLLWSSALACLYSLVFVLFDQRIVAILTDLTALRESIQPFLPYVWLIPLIAHWCFLFDGVFIGLTRGKAMRNSMILCMTLVFVPLWLGLLPLGNHGLWTAFCGFLLARGLTLGGYFIHLHKQARLCEG
nr:MATE family efflux transporter [Saliniradius amylolyticus]